MAIQIANPLAIAKIEQLRKATGLGKTAAVEAAVSRMLSEVGARGKEDRWIRITAILDQIHAIPLRADAFDAVEYDELGLPK